MLVSRQSFSSHIPIKNTTIQVRHISNNIRHQKVRYKRSLKTQDLTDLLNRKILALCIPNFCEQNVISHSQKKLNQYNIIPYVNANGVSKIDIGMAYFEADTPEKKRQYYTTKTSSFNKIRDIFHPHLSPVDKVRLSLDEIWPKSSSLLNLGNGSMFVGLIRSMQAGDQILPHEDKLIRDDPTTKEKINYIGQLAFNCYLTTPKQSGQLDLWDLTFDDNKYNKLSSGSYGIQRKYLPNPVISIQPKSGDLILFNSHYLHAVSVVDLGEKRISVSGFILYQGHDQPLLLWS